VGKASGVADVRQGVEDRLNDLGEFIRSQREVARISVRRLAELADVSNPYLSQIERGLRKPSAEILQQIAKALQISSESLYVRAGILDPERDPEVNVVDAVHRDPYLDAEQKRTLLRVYESLRAEARAHATAPEATDGNAASDRPRVKRQVP
jgi:transcriptional regulator with XRE-family HTH domain